MQTLPQEYIQTERLVLRASSPEFAPAVAKFHTEEVEHLAPWSPLLTPEYFSESEQSKRLSFGSEAFRQGTAWKWLMSPLDDLKRVIGFIHYSQVFRGVFQNAMLGYAVAKDFEGQGLMTEGLRATQNEVFGSGRLHRVQANVVPENMRSLALLERLGFRREGLAHAYLFINGKWRDHVMTACLNPHFKVDWLDDGGLR